MDCEWYSIDEKLPDFETNTVTGETMDVRETVLIITTGYEYVFGTYWDDIECWKSYHRDEYYPLAYWISLPEPPKELE